MPISYLQVSNLFFVRDMHKEDLDGNLTRDQSIYLRTRTF